MSDTQKDLEALAARPSLEMRFRDADGNGVLDPAEFVGDDEHADPKRKLEEFASFDANQDGVLTDEELKAGRKRQRGS